MKEYNDWRLPTIEELLTLVDYSAASPASYNNSGMHSYAYWSSTTYAKDSDYVWHIDFVNGVATPDKKMYLLFVRCVRTGKDGLEWSPNSLKTMTFTQAMDYAATLVAPVHFKEIRNVTHSEEEKTKLYCETNMRVDNDEMQIGSPSEEKININRLLEKQNKSYGIPSWVKDLDDLSEYLGLDPYEFNILKTLWVHKGSSHDVTNEKIELDKRLHYTNKSLEKYERINK